MLLPIYITIVVKKMNCNIQHSILICYLACFMGSRNFLYLAANLIRRKPMYMDTYRSVSCSPCCAGRLCDKTDLINTVTWHSVNFPDRFYAHVFMI